MFQSIHNNETTIYSKNPQLPMFVNGYVLIPPITVQEITSSSQLIGLPT